MFGQISKSNFLTFLCVTGKKLKTSQIADRFDIKFVKTMKKKKNLYYMKKVACFLIPPFQSSLQTFEVTMVSWTW